jgi:hypothetical protein
MKLAMAALSVLAVVVAVGIVAFTSTPRGENVWNLTACAKGGTNDQIKCCDSDGGVVQGNGGKCVPLPPAPLPTHDPSDVGTETFTPVPTTPVPTPGPSSATTQAPPTNPCVVLPVCAE